MSSKHNLEEEYYIIRSPHDRKNPYTMVSNELINDISISPECRFLLVYILSNMDTTKITVNKLRAYFKGYFGRDKILNLIKEARNAGYMSLEKYSENNLIRNRYHIAEYPIYKQQNFEEENHNEYRQPENQDIENTGKIQCPEIQITDKSGCYINNSSNNKYIYNNTTTDTRNSQCEEQMSASPPVVVFSSLEKLKLSDTLKEKISREYTEDEVNIAVKRTLDWTARKSDEAAIMTALSRPNDWKDKKTQKQIEKENLNQLEYWRHLDGKYLGKTLVSIGHKYIEFIKDSFIKRFEVTEIDFKDQVVKYVEKIKLEKSLN